ncbi:hypothetical protein Kyoto22A_11360 [Helicobacter pylori]
MKSILLFMIFVVCQLEGKKFSQDNFKVDYNYYLRKQDLHIIKTQNDLSNAWYLPPQKAPKEHSWVNFAKKYLNMMDYLGTYFLPFYHSFTPIFQWYHPNINPYQRNEFKFQISFRVPVFRHILWTKGTLYLAYTQTNWFQIYNDPQSAPMRMINFMPELIYVYPIKFKEHSSVQNSQAQKIFFDKSEEVLERLKIPSNALFFKGAFLLDAALALLVYEQFLKIKNLKWQDYRENALKRLNAFKIGSHKMEEFRDKQGRLWVDDSKATNIDATLQALKTFKNQKIHLILGGDIKGVNLTPLFEEFKNHEISLYAIGSSAFIIQSLALEFNVSCQVCLELEKAVQEIKSVLSQNEIALLSPSAASLDQFSSYKERGERFKAFVLKD